VYWRSRWAYLKVKGGSVMKWDDPFPCQTEEAELWQAGISTIDVKGRQTGQTSDAAHFALWDCMFHEAVVWNIVGADEDAGKDVTDRIQATLDRLPSWMLERSRMTLGASRKGKRQHEQQGVTVMTFGLSKLRVLTGSVRKLQGMTGKVLLDDFGKHLDQERKWQLTYPVIDDPNPEHRGQVIVIFNGNGKDFGYHLYRRAKSGEIALRARFLDWTADPRRLDGAFERDGKTVYPWYENARAQYLVENPEADEYAFRAQYPATEDDAFFLHGNSRFDLAVLARHSARVEEERDAAEAKGKSYPPLGFLVKDDEEGWKYERHRTGRLRLYIKPDPEGEYVVAVDSAGGRQAGDYCVAMVGRVYDEYVEQVAVYEAKVEPADELAYNGVGLAEMYNEALVIPETGSSGHGASFVNAIKSDYPNIYRCIRTSRWLDEEKEELGFATTPGSRNDLLASLAKSLGRLSDDAWDAEPTLILHDQRTIEQLQHFEIDPKTNKAQAPKGENDDLVICAGLLLIAAREIRSVDNSELVNYMPWEW
jgi:hypothetical protein